MSIFSSEQLKGIDFNRIPQHIAIMLDGNRRWAQQQLETTAEGYRAGSNAVIEIVKAGKELGVKVLTFYTFSTENWSRPQEEIDILMYLLEDFLNEQCDTMISSGVRLMTIGDLTRIPAHALEAVERVRKATEKCSDIEMVLALNYGGRDEICRAFKRILKDNKGNEITESLLSSYLDTARWKDPDLLIRPGGEQRLSNFLLWQLSYAEFYTTPVLWPDFTPLKLIEAVTDFQKRKRRLGGV